MIAISDTTEIISLLKVNQLALLQQLFDVVYIPMAVYKRLAENEVYPIEAQIVKDSDFLFVKRAEMRNLLLFFTTLQV